MEEVVRWWWNEDLATKSQERLRWRDMGPLLMGRKDCAKCAHPGSEKKIVGPLMGFVALVSVERLLLYSAYHDLGQVVRRAHRTQVFVQGQASGLLGRAVKYLKNLQCAPLVAAPPATS